MFGSICVVLMAVCILAMQLAMSLDNKLKLELGVRRMFLLRKLLLVE